MDNNKSQLVLQNLGLVGKIAKKFYNAEFEYEDLFQTGCIGLIKASKDYNGDLEVKFSTYAFYKIKGEIQRFLRDDGLIKVSRKVKSKQRSIYAAKYKLEKEFSREPTIQEIAKYIKCKEEEVKCINVTSYSRVKRFSNILFKNKNGYDISIQDEIVDNNCLEDTIIGKISLEENLNKLSKLNRDVLMLKLDGKTQSKIAEELSISQPAVSRHFRKTISFLKSTYLEA